MRLGLLTGGGDCPGLNVVIRAVVRTASGHGSTVIGYRHGWHGVTEADSVELTAAATHAILAIGGTMLGTSRYHPADHDGATERAVDTLTRDRIDALVVVGGDGTLAAAREIAESGVRILGVPKTIDNDVSGTDRCVGFDTALAIATEAVDRIHTTAESHDRSMVVEVMGHQAGWLAVGAGIAGGAHAILVPEEPVDLAELAAHLRHRHRRDSYSIIVVAEGASVGVDGAAGMTTSVGGRVRADLAARTGFETRLVVLGHVQRGGTPTAADRVLATRLGVAVVEAAHDGACGVMVGLAGDEITSVSLADATSTARLVPKELLHTAHALLR
jgi:6-phosphofructokinase 1